MKKIVFIVFYLLSTALFAQKASILVAQCRQPAGVCAGAGSSSRTRMATPTTTTRCPRRPRGNCPKCSDQRRKRQPQSQPLLARNCLRKSGASSRLRRGSGISLIMRLDRRRGRCPLSSAEKNPQASQTRRRLLLLPQPVQPLRQRQPLSSSSGHSLVRMMQRGVLPLCRIHNRSRRR